MKNPRDIIIRPLVTEKSTDLQAEDKKYTFEVAKSANKVEIANAVEELFDVKVEKVATMNMKGKVKRMGRFEGKRKDWKKAIVKLTPDSKDIELYAGV